MNAGQYEGILGRLDAILAKMPAAPVADSGTWSRVGGEFVHTPPPVPRRGVTRNQMEESAWEEARTWARGVLAEHGIRLDQDSRWDGREAELAGLLNAVVGP